MNQDRALLTVNEMERAERYAIKRGISAIDLMGNAGRAVAQAITARWSRRRVVVLCGPGNNGGDGFVVAQSLTGLGWDVRVALAGSRDRLPAEASWYAKQWAGPIEAFGPSALDGADLVVDALFGAGLNRPLQGTILETLAQVADRQLPMVAIDVPSGLMGDTGQSLGAVVASLTVTFFRKRPGHLLFPGRGLCGEVIVADIGIPSRFFEECSPTSFENGPSLWSPSLPIHRQDGNKYSRGHALILGGYPITGAARLAARGAARMGAGLTTIAVPDIAFPIYASSLTSIMVRSTDSVHDVAELLQDDRFNALMIGPGAGIGRGTRERTHALLATRRSTVVDADAISSFQGDAEALFAAIHGPCVMTPHEGEFQRLFDVPGDKLARARTASAQSKGIIVLKGPDTIIAAPDGRAIINSNAPPSLATAGSGDVLAGFILGLLAQGMDPWLASAASVWMHGQVAMEFGPGLIAEDISEGLPGVLHGLGKT